MTLLTRMTHLFRADLHAVLDRLEEPEALLRQAVRDMEEALSEADRQIRQKREAAADLALRGTQLQEQLDALEPELDICFEQDKSDLARALVRRKLETTRLLNAVRGREKRLLNEIEAQAQMLAAKRVRLESMRQKADVLSNRARQSDAADQSSASPFTPDFDEARWMREDAAPGAALDETEIEVAFLKEQQRRSQSS